MKKIYFLATALLMVVACKSEGKKTETEKVEKEVVIAAFIDLVEYGWLQSKKNTPRNGGKKTDVYFINPKIKIIQIPKSMN